MRNIFENIKLVVWRFFLLLILYQFGRLFFILLNREFYSELFFADFLRLSFYGFIFDISAIMWSNMLFFVLLLVPGNFKYRQGYQFFCKLLFVFVNSFSVLLNLGDSKFFEFEEQRSTAELFDSTWLGADFMRLLPSFIVDYWYVPLLWLLLSVLIWYVYRKGMFKSQQAYRLNMFFVELVVFLFVAFWVVIGARGGFALKPVKAASAAKYTGAHNIPIVINTPFSIMQSIEDKAVKQHAYFADDSLSLWFNPVRTCNAEKPFEKKNVVVIILESFGSEYVGSYNKATGYTPFLDSLIGASLYFPNSFANGKRSIEALPSVFAGLPALTEKAYMNTRYSTNQISSLATILKKHGYGTSFFHGGTNGTMSFDIYTRLAGFEQYFGRSEYNNERDYDGNWGIFDEPFLQYFAREMNTFEQPFFSSVFTLSSHHPYTIPDEYRGRFPKGELVNHESIGYSDYALSRFFATASQMPWFANTLFVLTADHTAQALNDYYKNKLGMYAVPIVFYSPSDTLLRGVNERVCQQADVFASVLDYLNCPESFVAYGSSVFSNEKGFAVNYINKTYQLITNDLVIHFDGDNVLGVYDFANDKMLRNDLRSEIDYSTDLNLLKAIIQQYNRRLVDNRNVCD